MLCLAHELDLHDWIDAGVISGKKDEEKPLAWVEHDWAKPTFSFVQGAGLAADGESGG